jgi:hypothetical protein
LKVLQAGKSRFLYFLVLGTFSYFFVFPPSFRFLSCFDLIWIKGGKSRLLYFLVLLDASWHFSVFLSTSLYFSVPL